MSRSIEKNPDDVKWRFASGSPPKRRAGLKGGLITTEALKQNSKRDQIRNGTKK
jgi:hypothetical protein